MKEGSSNFVCGQSKNTRYIKRDQNRARLKAKNAVDEQYKE